MQSLTNPCELKTIGGTMKKSHRTSFVNVFLILLSLNLFLPVHVSGQDTGNLFHWAYAPAFGTGFYRVEGVDTFMITFRPKIDLRKPKDDRIGIKLTLPLSFGLQEIDADKITNPDLEDLFTTASLVPGVELDIPIGQRWRVRPFGNIGWGTTLNSSESAWIYFGGAKSRYKFNWGKADLGFVNEVLWSGYQPNTGKDDHFSRIMFGLEADYPIGKVTFQKQQLYFRPHILYYRYFENLEFLVDFDTSTVISLDEELEVAMAVGTKELRKFWIFRPDRIGVGLRLSENLTGIRIFLRSVFD